MWMWARASSFRRFTWYLYRTDSVKISKTRHTRCVDIRIFLQCTLVNSSDRWHKTLIFVKKILLSVVVSLILGWSGIRHHSCCEHRKCILFFSRNTRILTNCIYSLWTYWTTMSDTMPQTLHCSVTIRSYASFELQQSHNHSQSQSPAYTWRKRWSSLKAFRLLLPGAIL